MALPPLDPQQRQKLLLFVLLILGGGYAFYEYLYKGRVAEVEALELRVENVRDQNLTARALAGEAGAGEMERKLSLYREQLQTVEALIPSSEELPDLLDAISAEAQRTGVELTLIQPVGATEEAYYTRRVYDIAVIGTYHDIGGFLARIGSLPRIVTPVNLTLAPRGQPEEDEAQQLEARFSIETYVLSATENAPNAE